MGLLLRTAELFADTLAALPLWALLLLPAVLAPPLVVWHELGHAVAALLLTRGPVEARVGAEESPFWFSAGRLRVVISPLPLAGGECRYDDATLDRGRDEAWIAAAGPLASALAAGLLTALALALGSADDPLVTVAVVGAQVAALQTIMTLLPIRYALGSGAAGAESDGLALRRILSGGSGRAPVLTHGVDSPVEPPVRPAYVVLLLVIVGLAFLTSVGLGLAVVLVFCASWLLHRHELRRGR